MATSQLPATMRACVLHGREDVRVEEVPVPVPGEGELLVRVRAALTCGTDLKVFLRGYHARMIVPPAVFGHEWAGEVAVSRDARFPVGTCVVAANSAPCGRCVFCEIGKPNLCRDLLFMNGAYAEYVRVPARIVAKNCLRIPDGVPAAKAALVEPLACAVKGVEDARIAAGERVLVIGAGPLGLLLARMCVLAGAEVTSLDAQPARLAVARELGVAHTVEAALTPETADVLKARTAHGLGFDCVFEAIGRQETWNGAVPLVRPGGRINLFGGCPNGSELRVDTARLHYEEVTLLASFHHTPRTIRTALELIADERVPALAIVREGRPLADLPRVLEELKAGGGAPKTALLPHLPDGARVSGAEILDY